MMCFDLKDIVVRLDQAVKHYRDISERIELALDDDLPDLEQEKDGVIYEITEINNDLSLRLDTYKEVEVEWEKK